MAWIEVLGEEAANAELKEAYDTITAARGKLSNIMQVQSLDPRAMHAHLDLYLAIMFGSSPLSRAEREMIAVVVSALNQCEYCIQHHAAALNAYWKSRERVDRLVKDYRRAELSLREAALADYAARLTSEPQSSTEQHIADLRAHSLSDAEILKANLIISYFNFVNRIALGLGVSFDQSEIAGYRY